MLWEEAQWIGPHQGLGRGVPAHLLVDIPTAMGSHEGKRISTLSIRTTMAPNYRSLFRGQRSLKELKAAVTSLRVSQVSFEPGDSSATSTWNPYDGGLHDVELYLDGNSAHLEKIDRYIGALISYRDITSVEMHLKRFWYGLSDETGFMGFGNTWCVKPAPCLRHLTLGQVPLGLPSLKRLTRALDEKGSLHLDRVLLKDDTWEAALSMLRGNMHGCRDVLIRSVWSSRLNNPNNVVHAYLEDWAVPSEDEDGAELNSGGALCPW